MTDTVFLVECKRYSPPHKVGVAVARQLYGVVESEGATGGIVATTSYFTAEAKYFAQTKPYRLYLRNFDDLADWLARAVKGTLGQSVNPYPAPDGERRR
jgi:restriction endonuclease Mrr